MLMPTIQSADLWRESGRYDAYGAEMLRIKDRHDRDMLFTAHGEELITDIFRAHVTSYKDLPLTMYQIQWKFRDEIRPRFGVMRGREFYMKDGYNFDLTKEDALHSYNRHLVSYLRTYERMGLQAIPMRADSGPHRRRRHPRVPRAGRDGRVGGVLRQRDHRPALWRPGYRL
jgi:prolyl-tRNA synthetase